MKDLGVAARNKVIDGLLHLPNLAICKALDDEFPPTKERPAPQFPDSWFREFGIKFFAEAYNNCPRLVNTMIWRRRKQLSP